MRFRFILFFFIISLSAITQNRSIFSYKETTIDTAKTGLDSILILGIGSTSSGFFLDNLSEKIIKGLKSGNLKAEYRYLGKTIAEAKEEFRLVQLRNYKALLLFLPKDSSFFEVKTSRSTYSVPTPTIGTVPLSTTTTHFLYDGSFDIRLYTNEEKMRLIWTAFIDVECQLTKTRIYSKISKRLITSFKNNRYIK